MPSPLQHQFKKIILSLSGNGHTDAQTIKEFLDRLSEGNLTRDENRETHFCSFTVPINLKNKTLFIVDHIKGKSWMPPGGHIDYGELPTETVRRELKEELGFTLTNEQVELFDICITVIDNPVNCRVHYDFWYTIRMEKINFHYDNSEFTAAGWFPYAKAYSMIEKPPFHNLVKKMAMLFKT